MQVASTAVNSLSFQSRIAAVRREPLYEWLKEIYEANLTNDYDGIRRIAFSVGHTEYAGTRPVPGRLGRFDQADYGALLAAEHWDVTVRRET